MLPVSHREALLRAIAEGQEGDAARLAGAFVAYLEGHCAPAGQRALGVEMLMLIVHQCQNLGLPADAILGPEGDIATLLAGTSANGIEAQLVALAGRAARACGNEPGGTGRARCDPRVARLYRGAPEGGSEHRRPGPADAPQPQVPGRAVQGRPPESRSASYIIRIRMRRACALLAGTSLKVYAVAEQVGYADAKHFATMFRAVIGVSPAEYRATHRGEPAPPEGAAP